MAQECMDIFERDKLPVVATVEQVCLVNERIIPTSCFVYTPHLELFNGVDRAR
jgi:hypothetical protein